MDAEDARPKVYTAIEYSAARRLEVADINLTLAADRDISGVPDAVRVVQIDSIPMPKETPPGSGNYEWDPAEEPPWKLVGGVLVHNPERVTQLLGRGPAP